MSQLLQLRQLLQLFVMKTSVPGKYLMRIIFLLILKLQLKILSKRGIHLIIYEVLSVQYVFGIEMIKLEQIVSLSEQLRVIF